MSARGGQIESVAATTAAEPAGISRSRLFRRLGLGLGALGTGQIAARALGSASGASARSPADVAVLELALELEHLQVAFYTQALSAGHLTGEAHQLATVVGHEERAHLGYLQAILGPKAPGPARYNFGDAFGDEQKFLAVAIRLEDAGLAAYNGQATNLSPRALAATARIISVEARHAAWTRSLAGRDPAPVAADVPASAAQTRATLRSYSA